LGIIAGRKGMRISPHGVRALIMHMSANGYLTEILQTQAKDWSEVHASPGDFSHSVFHDGPSRGIDPVFYEMGLRFGSIDLDFGYGVEGPVYFMLEFRGVAFEEITEEFIDRVDSILYVRPQVWVRAHSGLRSRDVPEGEEPEQAKRKRVDRVDGRIGTRIEEL